MRITLLSLAVVSTLALAGCEQHLTDANLNILRDQMGTRDQAGNKGNHGTVKELPPNQLTTKEVESILGPPTRIETGPEPEPVPVKSVAITRYIYEQNGKTVQLEFVGDHLVPNGIKGSFESTDADSKRTSQ